MHIANYKIIPYKEFEPSCYVYTSYNVITGVVLHLVIIYLRYVVTAEFFELLDHHSLPLLVTIGIAKLK